jgi:hypothetical protein
MQSNNTGQSGRNFMDCQSHIDLFLSQRPVSELYSRCVVYFIPVSLLLCYTLPVRARELSLLQSLQILWGPLRILLKVQQNGEV